MMLGLPPSLRRWDRATPAPAVHVPVGGPVPEYLAAAVRPGLVTTGKGERHQPGRAARDAEAVARARDQPAVGDGARLARSLATQGSVQQRQDPLTGVPTRLVVFRPRAEQRDTAGPVCNAQVLRSVDASAANASAHRRLVDTHLGGQLLGAHGAFFLGDFDSYDFLHAYYCFVKFSGV